MTFLTGVFGDWTLGNCPRTGPHALDYATFCITTAINRLFLIGMTVFHALLRNA
jgi:hypothetical protein